MCTMYAQSNDVSEPLPNQPTGRSPSSSAGPPHGASRHWSRGPPLPSLPPARITPQKAVPRKRPRSSSRRAAWRALRATCCARRRARAERVGGGEFGGRASTSRAFLIPTAPVGWLKEGGAEKVDPGGGEAEHRAPPETSRLCLLLGRSFDMPDSASALAPSLQGAASHSLSEFLLEI